MNSSTGCTTKLEERWYTDIYTRKYNTVTHIDHIQIRISNSNLQVLNSNIFAT